MSATTDLDEAMRRAGDAAYKASHAYYDERMAAGVDRWTPAETEAQRLASSKAFLASLPKLHTLVAVAKHIGKSERWLRGFVKKHGCGRRVGRAIVFTDSDVRQLVDALPCPSASSSVAASGTSTASSAPALPAKVSKFANPPTPKTVPSPKRAGRRGSRSYMRRSSSVVPFPSPSTPQR